MKKVFLLFLLSIFAVSAHAQVQVKARASKTNLSTNDRMAVRFDVKIRSNNVNLEHFTPPKFKGFSANGPSTSEEYFSVNGKMTGSFGFTYYLQPLKPGVYTIGKAQAVVNGKTYESNTLTVTVTKGKRAVANLPANNKGDAAPDTDNAGNEIFLVAETTITNPYVNQAVGLSYRLYFSNNINVQNYNEVKQTKLNGFWIQTVDKTVSGPFKGTYNGKEYNYYILNKKLLFPQQSGKLSINPLVLEVIVQRPVIRNYGFMRVQEYQLDKIHVKAQNKILKVKELPDKNKPDYFSGAVGKFNFSVNIEKNNVKVGEPVNISLIAKGTGNFKLFDLPKLTAPDGIEIYEPKHTEHLQTKYTGNSGLVKDAYVVVPNTSGKFIIPAIKFSFFNPKTNQYEERSSGDLILQVEGDGATITHTKTMNTTKSIASEFRYIKPTAKFVESKKQDFFGSKSFEILLSIPFILAFLMFGYHKYRSSIVYDAAFEKQKKSKSLAQKFLKDAKKTIGDKEMFYMNLEKAFHNFIKANLKIDTSEMQHGNIKNILEDKGVKVENISKLFGILNKCDMARYAPATVTKMEEDYAEAESVMNHLFEK